MSRGMLVIKCLGLKVQVKICTVSGILEQVLGAICKLQWVTEGLRYLRTLFPSTLDKFHPQPYGIPPSPLPPKNEDLFHSCTTLKRGRGSFKLYFKGSNENTKCAPNVSTTFVSHICIFSVLKKLEKWKLRLHDCMIAVWLILECKYPVYCIHECVIMTISFITF